MPTKCKPNPKMRTTGVVFSIPPQHYTVVYNQFAKTNKAHVIKEDGKAQLHVVCKCNVSNK